MLYKEAQRLSQAGNDAASGRLHRNPVQASCLDRHNCQHRHQHHRAHDSAMPGAYIATALGSSPMAPASGTGAHDVETNTGGG
jgi:hypothetical protein